ncbi:MULTISPECIES: MBL fold metallo-hydrolase [unclassified Lysinibacillus]|uniref:MBL fold metallo-hydrolase n=1 Tax=unclassified Lysinibacillus TaxID=2636778 RepID=UPI0020138DC5|nr:MULTISPECIES: MBL fold metallo-hydrolase [unclassified Lysinibacillus]MCL1697688.1 MBL fold metallo-hydrolase [Lysinibacillus sp. BPa_S21]MCL1702290.1 MBL fold metallo-hydrolase [Lysinibacillus sp. Bpr_S20]
MIQFQKNNITVFQSALYMTTSAIIQANETVIMTDPNWLPTEIEEIKGYINKIKGDKQLYIIYTHSDFDHIIGSGAFPEAKVIASKQFADNPNKEESIQKIKQFDQGYYLKRSYAPIYPTVDIVVSEDGYKLELDSLTMTFYQAPGHTNDGLFTVIEPYGLFLSGDYLSDIEFPFIFSSYKDYVNTIHTAENILLNHQITTHIPGHGTTTQNQQEIRKRVDGSKYYLEQLLHDNGELERYLSEEYSFFEGMKSIHNDNKKIAKENL